ncbi:ATP-dependent DNA ligase [Gonapodya prolifera JEL478]|uniref:DNA ligase n=1 Tax=Gonapodya prolifera (strain JEL478) TaxID=1344416 RepID=A0A139AVJ2_GONPJ|nr:ATP-dependent DNA ligase [Gonapodya prolifera JEL478]|eukprot:KXS20737.1 ATP-dependent DNA ligase [Gonapodya prolifera JEL478]
MDTDEVPKQSPPAEGPKKRKASPVRAPKTKAAKANLNDDVSNRNVKKVEEHDDDRGDESGHESEIDEAEVANVVLKAGGYDFGTWKKGEKVPYSALCRAFDLIEATTKRLEITNILSRFFKVVIETTPDCLLECLYLCINRLGAEYRNKELGIGESILTKAVASATGRSPEKIKADMEKMGDLGQVAQASRSNQPVMFKPKPLDVSKVFKFLKEISETSGKESQARKIDKIKQLLVACQENEPRYLIRSLEGKLRIGLAEQTVLVALASSVVMTDPELGKLKGEKLKDKIAEGAGVLKSVYSELPDYDMIVPAMLKYGIMNLADHCHLVPGIPLKPMLAHPTKSISEVLDRFEGIHFTCEWKYDGERAQIHLLENGETMVYSRNSEDLSKKYPDILERAAKIANEGVKSFVLDCEAVAWDKEEKKILPFQVLSTRKRKDVAVEDLKVQVCIFAFDLLYLNGKPLIKETFAERRRILHESFHAIEGEFAFAVHTNAQGAEDIQKELDESVAGGCEGLMVKTLDKDSSYEPSKRSRNWLKVKKDYLKGVGDTLDLVVIGAYLGRGKRVGVYGGYLLACYDPDKEEYQTICKIGTGFSEEDLKTQYDALKEHVVSEPKPYFLYSEDPRVKPDVWFEPSMVWEVQCADLSVSPVHKAAIGEVDDSKGISLRFPRFIRVRDDKNADDATSAEQVAEMYRSQKIHHQKGSSKDD